MLLLQSSLEKTFYCKGLLKYKVQILWLYSANTNCIQTSAKLGRNFAKGQILSWCILKASLIQSRDWQWKRFPKPQNKYLLAVKHTFYKHANILISISSFLIFNFWRTVNEWTEKNCSIYSPVQCDSQNMYSGLWMISWVKVANQSRIKHCSLDLICISLCADLFYSYNGWQDQYWLNNPIRMLILSNVIFLLMDQIRKYAIIL